MDHGRGVQQLSLMVRQKYRRRAETLDRFANQFDQLLNMTLPWTPLHRGHTLHLFMKMLN